METSNLFLDLQSNNFRSVRRLKSQVARNSMDLLRLYQSERCRKTKDRVSCCIPTGSSVREWSLISSATGIEQFAVHARDPRPQIYRLGASSGGGLGCQKHADLRVSKMSLRKLWTRLESLENESGIEIDF